MWFNYVFYIFAYISSERERERKKGDSWCWGSKKCNASPIAIHCVSVLFKSPHLSLCMRRSVMVYKDLRPKGRFLGQNPATQGKNIKNKWQELANFTCTPVLNHSNLMDFLPCDPQVVRDRLYDSVQDEHSADSETGKTWQGHWKNPNILLCITMSNLVTGTEHSSARSFDGQNKGRPKSRSKAKHLRRPQNEWRLAPAPSRRSVVNFFAKGFYVSLYTPCTTICWKKLGLTKTLPLGSNDSVWPIVASDNGLFIGFEPTFPLFQDMEVQGIYAYAYTSHSSVHTHTYMYIYIYICK